MYINIYIYIYMYIHTYIYVSVKGAAKRFMAAAVLATFLQIHLGVGLHIQGYLAHQKQRPPRTLQKDYA